MNITKAKTIKIHEFLKTLGVEPAKLRGENLWYHSPYREDKNPSFSVHMGKNIWHDMGTGGTGDLIDLVQLIYTCNVNEALHHIQDIVPLPVNLSLFEGKKTESHIEIVSVEKLQNPNLVKYLATRCISFQVACKYTNEVFYQVGVNNRTQYAVGFHNDSDGFELRNEYQIWDKQEQTYKKIQVKLASRPKDITSFIDGCDQCVLFEGFMDFLSYAQYIKKKPSDYIVLNGAGMITRALHLLKKYKLVFYFGDNDASGERVLVILKDANITVTDCRHYYMEFKDLNEMIKTKCQFDIQIL